MTGMHILYAWVLVLIVMLLVVWGATGPWILHRLGGDDDVV
jgi:hypothetical protein